MGQLGYHGLTKGQLGQVCLAIEKLSIMMFGRENREVFKVRNQTDAGEKILEKNEVSGLSWGLVAAAQMDSWRHRGG